MILKRLTFDYENRILIEKIIIRTPFKYEAIFQNSGCFIYFKNKGPKLLSSEEKTQIRSNEAVLLQCGNHFLDLLKHSDDEQVEVIVVHLYPEVLKKIYIQELPRIIERRYNNKRSQVFASTEVISKFIESLEFYFQNPSLVNSDLLELKIKELVLLLLQSKNISSILELISNLYSPKKVHLKEVIKLHLYSNLTIEELAKLCNLSISSFKRQFKKEFKDSPNNYINSQRIQKAKKLLSITNLSISEIAYQVGFNDPLYFTRSFKKKIGSTPTQYRLEHNK